MITHVFQRYRVAVYIFTSVFRNCKHRIAFPKAGVYNFNKLSNHETLPLVFNKWILGFLYAASLKNEKPAKKADKRLLEEADELFNENHYEDTYKLLKEYQDSDDVEALWRICRALYNHSKEELDVKVKKTLVIEAYQIIKRALSLNDNHFAVHKWYAILLDAHASYEGIKARINELLTVKNHMLKAAELNPKDATTLYMIGTWCFNIADMPWYQRKIASTLFASPPTSSYEEALKYLIKAEEIEPNFYSLNLLMLGKTYLRLKDNEKAIHYLKLTTQYAARTDEDIQVLTTGIKTATIIHFFPTNLNDIFKDFHISLANIIYYKIYLTHNTSPEWCTFQNLGNSSYYQLRLTEPIAFAKNLMDGLTSRSNFSV